MRVSCLPFALLAFAACTQYRPPFTQSWPPSGAGLSPGEAAVVFLWPATNCDPPGYFTIATADGRFVGNAARGAQLLGRVPAGETTFLAWNDVVETSSASATKGTVPVLHADLREGRTYYVELVFGEWDARGPRSAHGLTRGSTYVSKRCVAEPDSTTSAMQVLSPASEGWRDLPTWTDGLEAIQPDRAAGQAWLDANRTAFDVHRNIAEDRFAGLRPEARRLATLEPDDGVAR
jgi:hypothetical protein